jgi:hypothetical protein
MAAFLRFKTKRKGCVSGDLNRFDRIHLNGD